MPEDDFDPFDDHLDDEEDDLASECGSIDAGSCTLAGTEWCDWECPLHHEVFARRRSD